jgi:hypothetical protein
MALTNNGLGGVVAVSASGTTTLAGTTVSSNKNVHVKGLLIFNTSTTTAQICEIHVVPNSGGSSGSAAASNKIGRLTLTASDTAFFEFPYPLALTDTGDAILIANGSGSTVNVLPLGNVES